jgi:hypothetical protein
MVPAFFLYLGSLSKPAYTHRMATTQITPAADAVLQVVTALPPEAQQEVLDFALFLQSRISAEDAAWDAALESTTPEQAAKIHARIASQREQATPLFDEQGKLAMGKPA